MTHTPPSIPPKATPRVLLVDDEAANLEMLRYLLGDVETHVSSSGADALALLQRERFALMLCDQRMPGMTGVDVCARAREVSPHTRRVLMTAYADTEVVIGAINEGAVSRYIAKPIDSTELVRVVREELQLFDEDETLREAGSQLVGGGLSLAARSAEAEIAHDISNLLTPLSLLLQQIQQELGTDSPSREFLRPLVDEAVASMASLEAFAGGLRSGRLTNGSADLGRTLQATVRIFAPRLEAAADVEVDAADDLFVALDGTALTQVIANLLVNAVDAIESHGKRGLVHVSLSREGDQARLLVQDSGGGVPDSILGHIFESRFSTKTHGTGRGLAIARRIVESAEGRISVSNVDGGACFTVLLPLLVENPP